MRTTILFTLLTLALVTFVQAEKFYPDDPLLVDQDQRPVVKPNQVEYSQIYDFVDQTFVKSRNKEKRTEAGNQYEYTW